MLGGPVSLLSDANPPKLPFVYSSRIRTVNDRFFGQTGKSALRAAMAISCRSFTR